MARAAGPALEGAKPQVWVGDCSVELPELNPGDRLVPVTELSQLLVVSEAAKQVAADAVRRAAAAFPALCRGSEGVVTATRGIEEDDLAREWEWESTPQAWQRPELGLTNWETGRLLGRSGFLSGDDITSVRDFFIDQTGLATQRR